MKPDSDRCSKNVDVPGVWGKWKQCSRRGVIEEDGVLFCRQHAPSLVKERSEAKYKQWNHENHIRRARHRREIAATVLAEEALKHGLDEAALDEVYQALVEADRKLREVQRGGVGDTQ